MGVMRTVIRLSKPENFVSVQLCLAAGGVMMHENCVRNAKGGQFPLVKLLYAKLFVNVFVSAHLFGKAEKPRQEHSSWGGPLVYGGRGQGP